MASIGKDLMVQRVESMGDGDESLKIGLCGESLRSHSERFKATTDVFFSGECLPPALFPLWALIGTRGNLR